MVASILKSQNLKRSVDGYYCLIMQHTIEMEALLTAGKNVDNGVTSYKIKK